MSSVGVMTQKKSKCFVREKKKSNCPKKNFQSVEGRKKNVSVEFRVFGKRKLGEKDSSCLRKKIKVFFGED
jgi:hypothetical protein